MKSIVLGNSNVRWPLGSLYNKDITEFFTSEMKKLIDDSDEIFNYNNNYTVKTTDDVLTLSVDLPGVKREDLNVSVVGNDVSITSKRNGKESKFNYRINGTYEPYPTDATLEDGVLTLKFSKRENAKLKQVEVKIK